MFIEMFHIQMELMQRLDHGNDCYYVRPEIEFGNSKTKQKFRQTDSLEAEVRVVRRITRWR